VGRVSRRRTRCRDAHDVYECGIEVVRDQAQRISSLFNLEQHERDQLCEHFEEIFVFRLMPRIAPNERIDEVRAWLWTYFDAGRQGGLPRGAGWEATRIIGRRGRTQSLLEQDPDGEWYERDVPSWEDDPFRVLGAVETLRERVQDELGLRAERERARALLAEYVRTASPTDRLVLEGRADGLTYLQIGAREVQGPPTPADGARQRTRYRRAWQRVPADVADRLRILGMEPDFNPNKGRRRTADLDPVTARTSDGDDHRSGPAARER
jgi:isopentenyldiphosphate isomerase